MLYDENDTLYIKLNELAAQVTEGVILEIGSKKGASACCIASVAKVPVYCVDMWDLTCVTDNRRKRECDMAFISASNYELFKQNTEYLNVIPIRGISWEIAKAWDKPLGLLFIDGDHSYAGCMADYDGFAKYILPGGYLVIHDYCDKFQSRVVRAVDEIKQSPLWTDWELTGRTIYARREYGT